MTVLPNGSMKANELNTTVLTSFRQKWNIIHDCRQTLSEQILSVFKSEKVLGNKTIRQRKPQKDRLARRLSCCVFDIVKKHGFTFKVSLSKTWESEYPTLHGMVNKTKAASEGNLSLVIQHLFDAITKSALLEAEEEEEINGEAVIRINLDKFRELQPGGFDMIADEKMFTFQDKEMNHSEILDCLSNTDNENRVAEASVGGLLYMVEAFLSSKMRKSSSPGRKKGSKGKGLKRPTYNGQRRPGNQFIDDEAKVDGGSNDDDEGSIENETVGLSSENSTTTTREEERREKTM